MVTLSLNATTEHVSSSLSRVSHIASVPHICTALILSGDRTIFYSRVNADRQTDRQTLDIHRHVYDVSLSSDWLMAVPSC